MSEVWRGSTSAEMWAEIEALRRSNAAHVDTIMAALARAEAAEAKLDEQIEAAIALRHDLDTLRDLYGAAEARITAARRLASAWATPADAVGRLGDCAEMVFAALAEPVGQPPRCTPTEEGELGVAYCTRCIAPDGTPEEWPCPRSLVGDPQPPACATCGGTGWHCDPLLPSADGLPVPCPSCTPPDPESETP